MKTLQNNYTTPEQSKRLLELGVPADSSDCYYTQEEIEGNMYWFDLHIKREYQPHTSLHASTIWGEMLPCWSACTLMEIYDICEKSQNYGFGWNNYGRVVNYVKYLMYVFEDGIKNNLLDFSKLKDYMKR